MLNNIMNVIKMFSCKWQYGLMLLIFLSLSISPFLMSNSIVSSSDANRLITPSTSHDLLRMVSNENPGLIHGCNESCENIISKILIPKTFVGLINISLTFDPKFYRNPYIGKKTKPPIRKLNQYIYISSKGNV